MKKVNPSEIAKSYRESTSKEISENNYKIKIVGFLCTKDPAARKYADYTKFGCDEVGIEFELREIPRLDLEQAIIEANNDNGIHGIFIYYPIFNVERDNYLKNLVSPHKDIEGLNQYWISKLYKNERFDDLEKTKKSLLPCTPLAIVKILASLNQDLKGKRVSIFNRSEVVGRPLASMLAHDGAKVYSFDEYGPLLFEGDSTNETEISRAQALVESDIVITGVPSRNFEKIKKSEIKEGALGLNFSTFQNFEEDTLEHLDLFVPRVGPLTVTMCMRNALRLYKNYGKG